MKEKIAMAAIILAAFLSGIFIGARTGIPTEGMLMELGEVPQLSTEGFSKADVQVGPLMIYLASGCYRLSMATNEIQADSIEKGIQNITDARPTTHDTLNHILENFNIQPLMVKVDSLKDGTYYSKILLRQGNSILNLDSRPSDAIAVAVRAGAPVYVKNELLKEAGEKIC